MTLNNPETSSSSGAIARMSRAAARFEARNPSVVMHTMRHDAAANEATMRDWIERKLDDSTPFFATYDSEQMSAIVDHRTPFTQWYLGSYLDTAPTAYERDAGILPRRYD